MAERSVTPTPTSRTLAPMVLTEEHDGELATAGVVHIVDSATSAAVELIRAGTAPRLPSELVVDQEIEVVLSSIETPDGCPNLSVTLWRCLESTGEAHQEVELLVETDPDGPESVLMDLAAARKLIAVLVLAVAMHDHDTSAGVMPA